MGINIIKGNCHSDERGFLFYNNDFDAAAIKRLYMIENNTNDFIRGWQGHKIEQRWFSAVSGKFKVEFIKIDNWENPSRDLLKNSFVIDAEKFYVLHVPSGYVSSVQSLESNSKLLVMADYLIGEIDDEFRFDIDYFKK